MKDKNQDGSYVSAVIHGSDLPRDSHHDEPGSGRLEDSVFDTEAYIASLEAQGRRTRRRVSVALFAGLTIGVTAMGMKDEILTVGSEVVTSIDESFRNIGQELPPQIPVAQPQVGPSTLGAVQTPAVKNAAAKPRVPTAPRKPTAAQIACVMETEVAVQVVNVVEVPLRPDGGYLLREQASFENTRAVLDTYAIGRAVMVSGTVSQLVELTDFYTRSGTNVLIEQIPATPKGKDLGSDKSKSLPDAFVASLAAGDSKPRFFSDATHAKDPLPLSNQLDAIISRVEVAVAREELPVAVLARAAATNMLERNINPCR